MNINLIKEIEQALYSQPFLRGDKLFNTVLDNIRGKHFLTDDELGAIGYELLERINNHKFAEENSLMLVYPYLNWLSITLFYSNKWLQLSQLFINTS